MDGKEDGVGPRGQGPMPVRRRQAKQGRTRQAHSDRRRLKAPETRPRPMGNDARAIPCEPLDGEGHPRVPITRDAIHAVDRPYRNIKHAFTIGDPCESHRGSGGNGQTDAYDAAAHRGICCILDGDGEEGVGGGSRFIGEGAAEGAHVIR